MVYDDCGKSWIVRILDDFQGETIFFSLLTLFLVLPPSSILYYLLLLPHLPSFQKSSQKQEKGESISSTRQRQILVVPDPYPDSSCKITRVRALERRRVYSRKIALACTSARELVCAALIRTCTCSTIYLGKQGELHENTSTYRISNMVRVHYFNCNQIFLVKNSFGK